MPLLDFMLVCGQDVITIVERLEKRASGAVAHIPPSLFKVLESMYDAADYRQLAEDLLNETVSLTASLVKEIAHRIIRRRYWVWLLLHPELTERDLHPSRRVFPPCLCVRHGLCLRVITRTSFVRCGWFQRRCREHSVFTRNYAYLI